jgi:hypothetical protein
MSVSWQSVSVPLAAGVDTKSDAKVLRPPKNAVVENGVFDKPGRINKRYGSTLIAEGATIGTYYGLGHIGDEQLLLAGDSAERVTLYSYRVADALFASKGVATSPMPSLRHVQRTGIASAADCAYAGGEICYLIRGPGLSYRIDDEVSGSQGSVVTIATPHAHVQGRVVAVDSKFHIYYQDTSNDLKLIVITAGVAAAAVTVGYDTGTPATDFQSSTTYPSLAVEVNGTSVFVSYNHDTTHEATGGYTLWKIASTGATTAGPARQNNGGIGRSAVSVNSGGTSVILACHSAVSTLRGYVYNGSLVYSGTSTVLGTPTIAEVPALGAVWAGSQCLVVWEDESTSRLLGGARIDGAGTVTTLNIAPNWTTWQMRLTAKPFYDSVTGSAYVLAYYKSTLQPALFLIDLGDGSNGGDIVARLLPGIAFQQDDIAPWIGTISSLGSQRFLVAHLWAQQTPSGSASVSDGRYGVVDLRLDFADRASYRGIPAGRQFLLPGGLVRQYDGEDTVEAGFMAFPPTPTAAASNSTGTLTSSASYSYKLFYEWVSSRGQRERSTHGGVATVTLGASDDTVTLTVLNLPFFNRRVASGMGSLCVAVYRTLADPTADAPYYFVSRQAIDASITARTFTIVDTTPDSSLDDNELLLFSLGELDHVAPPSAKLLGYAKGRVWVVNALDPSELWYSKVRTFDDDPWAWNDALTLRLDDDGGDITGVVQLNESVIVFKERRVYVIVGDGPDNLGQGGIFVPQLVHSDSGCSESASIVVVPMGIMFKSAKGIQILSQSLQIEYVGAAVESFNAQTITAATLMPDRHQVRFLCSSGSMLVFDYFQAQWSTFSAWAGIAADVANGSYYYATTSALYKESASLFTDNSSDVAMKVVTPWIALDGIQGYQRVRRAHLIGEYKSACTIRVRVAYADEATTYDSEPASWDETFTFTPSAGTVLQFRMHLSRQKCQAIKFEILDTSLAGTKESFTLSELRLEVGVLGSGFRLPASASKGGS